jgi:sulfur-carrier protein
MSVKLRIPTPLRKLTNENDEVTVEGSNIAEMIDDLEKNYPGIKERICDDSGKLRRFVNIYVNDEDIRFKNDTETSLKDGDEVSIIPAIAGGGLL